MIHKLKPKVFLFSIIFFFFFGPADLLEKGTEELTIDEILERAETAEETQDPGSELLNAFKVASFVTKEENDDFWEKTIPEALRKEHEESEVNLSHTSFCIQLWLYSSAKMSPFL